MPSHAAPASHAGTHVFAPARGDHHLPLPSPGSRRQRTRQALIDAAGQLFSKQGVERTTVEEIAEAANLSVGSIYKHFANKEALAVAFIDESLAIAESYIGDAMSADSPVDRILGAGDAYFRYARDHSAACRFAMMRAFDPSDNEATDPIDRAMAKRIQRILLAIAENLKEAMDAGLLRRMPIDEAMVFLWGTWSGVAHQVIRQDPLRIPAELGDRALGLARAVLTDALGPTRPPTSSTLAEA
ncbi:MAG: TetR/AcrR family transcriptional regulator [Solirubrobacteraceae bacterium]|nr:TetR/AcrR family transcriptional regulator [Solirubrobacteraceae bacterium]